MSSPAPLVALILITVTRRQALLDAQSTAASTAQARAARLDAAVVKTEAELMDISDRWGACVLAACAGYVVSRRLGERWTSATGSGTCMMLRALVASGWCAGVARLGALRHAMWKCRTRTPHSTTRRATEAPAPASKACSCWPCLARARSAPPTLLRSYASTAPCAATRPPRLKKTLEFKVQLEKQVAQYKNMVAFLQAEVSSLSRERDALKTNLQVGTVD